MTTPPPGLHRHPIDVRFGACDPVGIAYFPRYFDWFHQAMESWFDQALGLPYAELLKTRGFPAVHAECDYQRPCAFGERVTVELRVGALGRSSLRLDYRVVGPDGDLRASGHSRVVQMGTRPGSPEHLKSQPIDGPLRAAILRFGAGGQS